MADCTRAYRFEGIIRAVASHNVPVTGPSATAGAFKQTTTPQLNSDQAASRLALACLATAAVIVLARLVDGLITTPPHIPDPISRLALLATLLVAAGLYASARLALLPAPLLIRGAIVFELLAVFSVAVAETGRPLMFPRSAGLSAAAIVIAVLGPCFPRGPLFILAVGVSAASTWLLGYVVNAMRMGLPLDMATALAWSAPNYAIAVSTYLLARAAQRTVTEELDTALGGYKLVELLGEGAMGEVWRARHHMLARPAALKIIKASVSGVSTARFSREANIIASLQSPHTVQLYDFGTMQDGRLDHVMELLEGLSLQTLISQHGPQPEARVVAILRQICQSLEEAHTRDFVHRDLKPSNVMVCRLAGRHDFVKVLDFGLARPIESGSSLTVEGIVVGTPEYIAPEMALGSRTVDGKADIYALGCIAYVLLTGKLVFKDENPLKLALRHARDVPRRPSARTDRFITPGLEALVMQCLEKAPAARPPTARAMEEMLASCGVGEWTDADARAWWERHAPAFVRPLTTAQGATFA